MSKVALYLTKFHFDTNYGSKKTIESAASIVMSMMMPQILKFKDSEKSKSQNPGMKHICSSKKINYYTS